MVQNDVVTISPFLYLDRVFWFPIHYSSTLESVQNLERCGFGNVDILFLLRLVREECGTITLICLCEEFHVKPLRSFLKMLKYVQRHRIITTLRFLNKIIFLVFTWVYKYVVLQLISYSRLTFSVFVRFY